MASARGGRPVPGEKRFLGLLDHRYAVEAAVTLLLVVDGLLIVPLVQRRLAGGDGLARVVGDAEALTLEWFLVLILAVWWSSSGRSWASLGLALPASVAQWAVSGLAVLLTAAFGVQRGRPRPRADAWQNGLRVGTRPSGRTARP